MSFSSFPEGQLFLSVLVCGPYRFVVTLVMGLNLQSFANWNHTEYEIRSGPGVYKRIPCPGMARISSKHLSTQLLQHSPSPNSPEWRSSSFSPWLPWPPWWPTPRSSSTRTSRMAKEPTNMRKSRAVCDPTAILTSTPYSTVTKPTMVRPTSSRETRRVKIWPCRATSSSSVMTARSTKWNTSRTETLDSALRVPTSRTSMSTSCPLCKQGEQEWLGISSL